VDAAQRRRVAQDAFAQQSVKLGDLVGHTAGRLAAAHGQQHAIDCLQGEIHRCEEDLVRLRSRLDAVHGSGSWRLTAPLRAAKRGLQRLPTRV
jgi:hypothetical protein